MRQHFTLTLIVVCMAALPVGAQERADSAAFIVRLGNDTTAVERYVRTPERIVIEALQRSPATTVHRLVMVPGAGARITSAEWTVRAPGAANPVVQRTVAFAGDSALITTTQAGAVRTQRVAARDAIPIAGPFYTPYELAIMRVLAGSSRTDNVPLLAGANLVRIPIQRVGQDSVALNNQFDEPMRAHIDARGRLLHLHTPAYTTVERLRWIDLDRLVSTFAGRDTIGKALGALSPRQTYRARVDGANIWIDYGRPLMRGRPIWGALVPWDKVWRMGANDAAHISTDRTLEVGSLTLVPGTYTLFLLPAAAGRWSLIVNRATGMSGLDYDAQQDLGRVELTTETTRDAAELFTIDIEDTPDGGRLALQWDRTRAAVPFRVK
jgi:hypothetical protein